MYLETIYVLTEGGSLARTRDIAAEWKVSQPSATEMVQKLAAQGYLHYEPYKGASLTPEGMELGRAVIRKHRLLERFLVEIVKVPAAQAEDPACEMEHVIPAPLEAWICELLGHPTTSMKGEPIPPGPCCPARSPRRRSRPATSSRRPGTSASKRQVVIASATASDANIVVTNDGAWRRPLQALAPNLRLVVLDEVRTARR